MEVKRVEDLFALSGGETLSKRTLFDLVQYSKVEGSPFWSGAHSVIGNTPQQGINWIGNPPDVRAVIIKTRPGAYETDGWANETKTSYQYSFKARKGKISYEEIANRVLIKQPQLKYPILLFTEDRHGWRFEGRFSVTAIEEAFVVLNRGDLTATAAEMLLSQDEEQYQEGERKYVTHLMAERNRGVVKLLKRVRDWTCDICRANFFSRYRVRYIEAHHKIPISTYSAAFSVHLSDFALLCPNCHKAVHIYMKTKGLQYSEIKSLLSQGTESVVR